MEALDDVHVTKNSLLKLKVGKREGESDFNEDNSLNQKETKGNKKFPNRKFKKNFIEKPKRKENRTKEEGITPRRVQ